MTDSKTGDASAKLEFSNLIESKLEISFTRQSGEDPSPKSLQEFHIEARQQPEITTYSD